MHYKGQQYNLAAQAITTLLHILKIAPAQSVLEKVVPPNHYCTTAFPKPKSTRNGLSKNSHSCFTLRAQFPLTLVHLLFTLIVKLRIHKLYDNIICTKYQICLFPFNVVVHDVRVTPFLHILMQDMTTFGFGPNCINCFKNSLKKKNQGCKCMHSSFMDM